MAKLISQLYDELQPVSACPEKMEPFKDDLNTHGHLTSLRNKPQQSNLENSQRKYPSELLVNVYSYHVMVKSMPCCCVHGSHHFSDLFRNSNIIVFKKNTEYQNNTNDNNGIINLILVVTIVLIEMFIVISLTYVIVAPVV